MGDPKGFLKIGRKPPPKRAVGERVQDYRYVYEPMPDDELRGQASRCMDCGVPFCNTGCPLGNLIPDWNDLVYRDHWKQAIDRLHRTNNFPEFTGMLCPAPCESACVLAINDKPVTIKEIELSIINRAFDEGWVVAHPTPPEKRTGKKVAVVGSGPAGLAAAQQLNWAGHTVVVFEKDDKVGGLLRYGIPDYKIEKWVVDRRVAMMEEEGVEFRPNSHVGGDTSADCLGNSHREGCASVKVLTHGPKPPENPDHLTWPDWPLILHTYPAHEEGGERGFSVAVKGRLQEEMDLGYTDRGAIHSENGFGTKKEGVFVAGDAKRGASLIVWAIAEGRKAARQADEYLVGRSLLPG